MALTRVKHSPYKALQLPQKAGPTCQHPDDHFRISSSPRFRDQRIHSWYSTVMAFPDHLVASILDFFAPNAGAVFLDPHCGSGTSLVEAQRRGLQPFGLDANPSSVLASRVKTNWTINLRQVRIALASLVDDIDTLEDRQDDPIVCYLQDSGMINRGWITYAVAVRAAAIKRWIDKTIPSGDIRRFFMLALIATVVKDLSNVKFGPELYCVPPRPVLPDVASCIIARLQTMVADLESWDTPKFTSQVRLGDSRDGRSVRTAANWGSAPAFVVTSPPYPTEHDYTRNSRLELVFMEAVADVKSLQLIKKKMIRSHSKGIYVTDRDANMISNFEPVQRIKLEIEERISNNASGFEGQYTKVVTNYFGGMLRHFQTLSNHLPVDSRLAYIVGDEASYKGVHIPTAQLLAEIIDTYVPRLKLDSVALWRSRRTHKNRQPLYEHMIFLTVE